MSKHRAPRQGKWGFDDFDYTLPSGKVEYRANSSDFLDATMSMLTHLRDEVQDTLRWIEATWMPEVRAMQKAAKAQNRRVVLVRDINLTPVDVYVRQRITRRQAAGSLPAGKEA